MLSASRWYYQSSRSSSLSSAGLLLHFALCLLPPVPSAGSPPAPVRLEPHHAVLPSRDATESVSLRFRMILMRLEKPIFALRQSKGLRFRLLLGSSCCVRMIDNAAASVSSPQGTMAFRTGGRGGGAWRGASLE